MMVDFEISELLIQPFDERQLTPNGYDVSVAEIQMDNKKLISMNGKGFSIPPKKNFIVLTKEKIIMKSNTTANLWIKTRWARQGLILSAGAIDAGFNGQLNLCMFNSSDNYIDIKENDTIVQIVFFQTKLPKKLYEERSGNYQYQDKIIK